MLILVAVHQDRDILDQKRLSTDSEKYLAKHKFGADKQFISHAIDNLCFEAEDLVWTEMPDEIRLFIDKNDQAEYYALDERFHDKEHDFNYEEWLDRAYPGRNKRKTNT
jgi:hypothetical protein